jgi:hypothetical protein
MGALISVLITLAVIVAGVVVIWRSLRLLPAAFGQIGATKRDSYSAVVAEKLVQRSDDSETPDRYVLKLRTSEGDTRQVAIGRRLWESCEIGDQLVKQPGKWLPQKV